MSGAEDTSRAARAGDPAAVTIEDVRTLMGASTPHFALQLRDRIARLIDGLPPTHPARIEGEREIARLNTLGFTGETRGIASEDAERPLPALPSLDVRDA